MSATRITNVARLHGNTAIRGTKLGEIASALYPLLTRINAYLMRWVGKKYRRFQGRREFQQPWRRVTNRYPGFFAHWAWTTAVQAVW